MSEHWAIFIPEEPGHVPSPENQSRAEALLRELCPNAGEVCTEVTEQIRFQDCGNNFERILCPNCGREIEMDWWSERMGGDFSADRSFKLQKFDLPCCGAKRRLHDLKYEWPMGFARFAVKVRDGIGQVPSDYLAAMEAAAGCRLRVIYCRV